MTAKYSLLYADPPWSYGNTISNGAAADHYSTKMQFKPLSHLEMHDMANSLITAKPRVRSDHGHHRYRSRDRRASA